MKNSIIILLVTMVAGAGCTAQKKNSIRLFPYVQSVIPGNIPREDIPADGEKETSAEGQKLKYLIYAEVPRDSSFKLTAIWIKGVYYTAVSYPVAKTPVTKPSFDQQDPAALTELVPRTQRSVILINPVVGSPVIANTGFSLPEKMKNQELVVGYVIRGKTGFAAARRFIPLSADISQ
ncbi:MAG: hypothetical protein GC171_08315 [Terrimonas sp.]|nr:hypothetical protein [Terrimonas sp.]